MIPDVLILMNAHQVEPILLLRTRSKELDLPVPERSEKSLISYITHTIQCQLGLPLLQQHRLYDDIVRFWSPSVVIDKSRYLQQIQGS